MAKRIYKKTLPAPDDRLAFVAAPALRREGIYIIDNVEYEYVKPLNGELHMFVERATGRTLSDKVGGAVGNEWIIDMMAAGRFYCLLSAERQLRTPQFFSVEELAAKEPRAALMHRIALATDKIAMKSGRLTKGALLTVISAVCNQSADLIQAGAQVPTPRAVRHALQTRGLVGNRTARDFISQSGRVPRASKISAEANVLIDKSIAWAVENKQANKLDAWKHYCLLTHEINISKRSNGEKALGLCSRSTFYDHYDERMTVALIRRKLGEQHYKKTIKPVGKSNLVHFPGECYQIDHTVGDIFVVHKERKFVIGRPYITIVIDVFSRLILAIVVGFTPPSRSTVFQSLKEAFSPKSHVYLVDKYPALKSAFGIPNRIIADNGMEFASPSFISSLNDIGVAVIFSRYGTPTDKPQVESYFNAINNGVLHRLRGVSFHRVEEKLGEYDAQKSASIDLTTLNDILQKFVSLHNIKSREALEGASPILVWSEHVKMHPMRAFADLSELKRVIGVSRMRILSRKGVRVEHLLYGSEAEISSLLAGFIANIGYRASYEVRCIADPDDMGEIQVYCPFSKAFVTLRAKEYDYASGRSLFLHKLTRKMRRQENESQYNQIDVTVLHAELIEAANNPKATHSRKREAARIAADVQRTSSYEPEASHAPSGTFAELRLDGMAMPEGRRRGAASNNRRVKKEEAPAPQVVTADRASKINSSELPDFSEFF